jgi:AraC family ethanolamine operon transcriptional activator
LTRLIFNDFEAFAETIKEASVMVRVRSLGEPQWTLQSATTGSLELRQAHEGGGTIAEGATDSHRWTFYHQSHAGLANGQVIDESSVFVDPPGGEFCLVCHESHEWLSVHVPTSVLFPSWQELELASSVKAHRLKAAPHMTRRFTSLVRRFLSSAESHPQLLDSPAAKASFENELLEAANDLFTGSQHSPSRHFVRWHRQSKSAVEVAMSCRDQPLSIPELARQGGIPERTLRSAFQQCYGVSPAEYLRIHRLHQARRLLRVACPNETTVTQIAFGLGFWDLGRFAGTYQRLFGERPSETLRKPARR